MCPPGFRGVDLVQVEFVVHVRLIVSAISVITVFPGRISARNVVYEYVKSQKANGLEKECEDWT